MTAYLQHLRDSESLITTHAATRAGFVALALEKSRRATPYVAEARALQSAVALARRPADLLRIPNIENGLLTAAGLSEKALAHLGPQEKTEAIDMLIRTHLEPAGEKFVEELVYRFLLTRGDALGGSMRNVGGALAQRKLTRAILSALAIAGVEYFWQDAKTRAWNRRSQDDVEIEFLLRGLHWRNPLGPRTLLYNLTVPLVGNNIDLCLLGLSPEEINSATSPEVYLALGELKGGIDPAGADEHWKTARTALERIRQAFAAAGNLPKLFFIGAAIEKRMADEIWQALESGQLDNAANLNTNSQLAAIAGWLSWL